MCSGTPQAKIETDDTSSSRLAGLLGSSADTVDDTTAVNLITSTIRSATLSHLSVPCTLESTSRALVLVSGPPEWLNRKGIERGRRWLEETTECREVRGGDFLVPESGHVTAVVLLSNVQESDRLDRLEATASEAQETQAQRDARSDTDAESLRDDQLDDLF